MKKTTSPKASKRIGRPKLKDGSKLNLFVTNEARLAAYRLATNRGISVSGLVRELILKESQLPA